MPSRQIENQESSGWKCVHCGAVTPRTWSYCSKCSVPRSEQASSSMRNRVETASDNRIQANTYISARKHLVSFGVLFGAFFVISGIVFAYILSIRPIAQSLWAQSWQTVPCRIVTNAVNGGYDGGYSLEFVYQYELDGKQYQGDRYHYRIFAPNRPC